MRKSLIGLFFLAALTLLRAQVDVPATTAPPSTAPGPTTGQKIIFYGDATVQDGLNAREGFVHLIDQACQQQGVTLVFLHQLTPGYTSRDLLANLKKSALAQQPDWLVFGCGYFDSLSNLPPAQFTTNVAAIIDQATAAGAKVVLLTPLMNGEDPATPPNQKMIPYCAALRTLAQQKNLPLVDLNAAEQAELAKVHQQLALPTPGLQLTNDAVHLNGLGHEMVATEILRTFGFTPAQLAQARDTWLDLPDGMDLIPRGTLSVRQYLQLRSLAAGEGLTVNQLVYEMLQKDLLHLLVNGTPPEKKKH